MDARLLVFIIWAALEIGLFWGYIAGTKFGVHVSVKAYLKEQNALDTPVPSAFSEYFNDVRASLLAAEPDAEARAWARKHHLPFNSETFALFKDVDYRRGVDGD